MKIVALAGGLALGWATWEHYRPRIQADKPAIYDDPAVRDTEKASSQ